MQPVRAPWRNHALHAESLRLEEVIGGELVFPYLWPVAFALPSSG